MNYCKLTKEEIINSIHKSNFYFNELEDRFKNDKEIVLAAIKNDIRCIKFISIDFLSDKDVLEVLENCDIEQWSEYTIKWYQERMEVLKNIRNEEDKEFIETFIIPNKKISKKIKF